MLVICSILMKLRNELIVSNYSIPRKCKANLFLHHVYLYMQEKLSVFDIERSLLIQSISFLLWLAVKRKDPGIYPYKLKASFSISKLNRVILISVCVCVNEMAEELDIFGINSSIHFLILMLKELGLRT